MILDTISDVLEYSDVSGYENTDTKIHCWAL